MSLVNKIKNFPLTFLPKPEKIRQNGHEGFYYRFQITEILKSVPKPVSYEIFVPANKLSFVKKYREFVMHVDDDTFSIQEEKCKKLDIEMYIYPCFNNTNI